MSEIELHHEHPGDPTSRRVGILVGVVGILLSVVTISSHRAHTDAVIKRTEANDKWTYYQAKKTRAQASEVGLAILGVLTADPAKVAGASGKLSAAREHYETDAKEIQKEAFAKDAETMHAEKRALYFDLGEGMLELGLVLCSLYFMARKNFFPVLGITAAALGTVIGVLGYLI